MLGSIVEPAPPPDPTVDDGGGSSSADHLHQPPPLPPPLEPPEPTVEIVPIVLAPGPANVPREGEAFWHWARSVIALKRVFDFADSPEHQNLEVMYLSLVSTSVVAPDSRTDTDSHQKCLQWVVWDDVAELRVRKTRIIQSGPEIGKLVFTPKIGSLCMSLKDGIERGSVTIILRNAGVRMIRRSGMFKPDVPKHALLFEAYHKGLLRAKHIETDVDSDGGRDTDAADRTLRCLVCGVSSRHVGVGGCSVTVYVFDMVTMEISASTSKRFD